MSNGQRYPLAQAQAVAEELRAQLSPACDRIEIAGDVRRNQRSVSGIVLLCNQKYVPRKPDPFERLVQKKVLRVGFPWRKNLWRDKREYPPYFFHVGSGIPCEVVGSYHTSWGTDLFFETGPLTWNAKALARLTELGIGFDNRRIRKPDRKPLATPEEEDIFRLLGWDYIAPESRR